MPRKPWYATAPPILLEEEEAGWSIHGLWIPLRAVSPTGELPKAFERRIVKLLIEYAALCRLTGAEFPIVRGYTPLGPRLHTEGWAIDIAPTNDWTTARIGAQARIRWRQPGSRLRGVLVHPRFVHLDIRPRRRKIISAVRSHDKWIRAANTDGLETC